MVLCNFVAMSCDLGWFRAISRCFVVISFEDV